MEDKRDLRKYAAWERVGKEMTAIWRSLLLGKEDGEGWPCFDEFCCWGGRGWLVTVLWWCLLLARGRKVRLTAIWWSPLLGKEEVGWWRYYEEVCCWGRRRFRVILWSLVLAREHVDDDHAVMKSVIKEKGDGRGWLWLCRDEVCCRKGRGWVVIVLW